MAAMRFPGAVPDLGGTACDRWRRSRCCSDGSCWASPGGVYYLLPRLTGASLRAEGLANLALAASAGIFGGRHRPGGLGFGDGREPFAIPWWWDVPVLAVLCVPAVVTLGSLGERRESTVYPSLWFMVAGVTWLPVLYLAGNLPGLRSLAIALGDLVFTAGFLHVWALGVATGLAYYVVPEGLGPTTRQSTTGPGRLLVAAVRGGVDGTGATRRRARRRNGCRGSPQCWAWRSRSRRSPMPSTWL